MQLEAHETELEGVWQFKDGRVRGDATEKRINWLTMNSLKRIAFTNGGYDMLYQDPSDGRYWELTFPHPQGFGEGPRRLCVIEKSAAVHKYNLRQMPESQ